MKPSNVELPTNEVVVPRYTPKSRLSCFTSHSYVLQIIIIQEAQEDESKYEADDIRPSLHTWRIDRNPSTECKCNDTLALHLYNRRNVRLYANTPSEHA